MPKRKRHSSKEWDEIKKEFVDLNKMFGDADGSNICHSSPKAIRYFRQLRDEADQIENESLRNEKPTKLTTS